MILSYLLEPIVSHNYKACAPREASAAGLEHATLVLCVNHATFELAGNTRQEVYLAGVKNHTECQEYTRLYI